MSIIRDSQPDSSLELREPLVPERRFLTVKETADLLNVSVRWVYAQCKKQQLPAVQLGGLWRIDRAKLEAMLKVADTPQQQGSRATKPSPVKPVAHLNARKILATWRKKGVVNLPEPKADA